MKTVFSVKNRLLEICKCFHHHLLKSVSFHNSLDIGVPEQPKVSKIGVENLTVSWTASECLRSNRKVGFILEYKEVGSSEWIRANTDVITEMEYTVQNLNWTSAYQFRVFAVWKAKKGPASPISKGTFLDISVHMTIYISVSWLKKNIYF